MARDRNYERNHERNYRPDRYDRDDRDLGDRMSDEMRSWFGDEGAERRRRMDRLERERSGGSGWLDAGGRHGIYREYPDERFYDGGWGAGRDPYGEPNWNDLPAGGRYGLGMGGMFGARYPGPGFGGVGYPVELAGAPRYRDDRNERNDRNDRYQRWGASDWNEQSARRRGPHYGRGPEGYKRSAERITEDANDALTWDHDVDASKIQVSVEGDEVTLEGTVDSRRAKRAAEDAVERVRGVRDVHNRLRVQSPEDMQGPADTPGMRRERT